MSSRQLCRLALPRTARPVSRVYRRQPIRFQSTSSSSNGGKAGSAGSHLGAGVAGGLATAVILYTVYSFSTVGRTASSVNKTMAEVNKKVKAATDSLQNNTPDADQAVNYIKEFAYSYVGWIPGGRHYVDAAFKDWDTIRAKHKDKVDQIVKETYTQIQEVAKSGLSMESATKAADILADLGKKIADISSDAASDVLENHPHVKKELGGVIDQLQSAGNKYGEEGEKLVSETWSGLKDIFMTGFSAENIGKAKKLAEEKIQKIRELGDKAWTKALDEAKPYLDKNPKIKKLLDENAGSLKNANLKELFDKVRSGTESGNEKDLEKYVWSVVEEKAKADDKSQSGDGNSSGSGSDILSQIWNGDEILPKLKNLKEVADKNKDEGEKLLKETLDELKKVLDQKAGKAKDLFDSAKEEGKETAKKDDGKGKKESK